jgi:hypothetical protein
MVTYRHHASFPAYHLACRPDSVGSAANLSRDHQAARRLACFDHHRLADHDELEMQDASSLVHRRDNGRNCRDCAS